MNACRFLKNANSKLPAHHNKLQPIWIEHTWCSEMTVDLRGLGLHEWSGKWTPLITNPKSFQISLVCCAWYRLWYAYYASGFSVSQKLFSQLHHVLRCHRIPRKVVRLTYLFRRKCVSIHFQFLSRLRPAGTRTDVCTLGSSTIQKANRKIHQNAEARIAVVLLKRTNRREAAEVIDCVTQQLVHLKIYRWWWLA